MIKAKRTKKTVTLQMDRKDYDLLTYVVGEYSELALESDCESDRYRDLYNRIVDRVENCSKRPDGERRLA